MGIGDPLEAEISLSAPLPAGSWHLVGDGIVLSPCDVTFDVIRRRGPEDGGGAGDTLIATFAHHFDLPTTNHFDAVAYEETKAAAAADYQAGDRLVLRFTTANGVESAPWIPNGDGDNAHGRIPSLEIPH